MRKYQMPELKKDYTEVILLDLPTKNRLDVQVMNSLAY